MHGRRPTGLLSLLLCVLLPSLAHAAEEQPRMLVLQLRLDPSLQPELGRQLENLLVTHLRQTERYQVMSQADVVSILGVEQQKQLVGCDESSCMAELGGALGARWMVSGSVGKLGPTRMLTLKLLDVDNTKIDNQLTKQLPEDDGELAEVMRVTSYELVHLKAPVLEAPWYRKWWVWTLVGAGVGAVVAVSVGVAVGTSGGLPDSSLGRVEL